MKRLIKYHNPYGETAVFSDCSTKYELLGLYPDTADGQAILEYAKANGIPVDGDVFTPKDQTWNSRAEHISHAVKLTEVFTDTRGWGKPELRPVYLGLFNLNRFETGVLKPVDGINTEVTKDQAHAIINNQEYGISSVGETVDHETVLVKQGWEYFHQIPMLGYSLESFETAAGITEHGFEDDTSSCHECGLYDSNDDCYTQNFRVVEECTLLGVRCGCYGEYCNSDEVLDSYADECKAMELESCEAWQAKGRLKFVERFIGGMVDGRGGSYGGEATREGTPKGVLKELKAKYPKRRYVFSLDESGQFQTYFSVWQVLPKPRVVKAKPKAKRRARA